MIPCKVFKSNGNFQWKTLPSPSNEREFLKEIKRVLHIPGESQAVDTKAFCDQGFTHITDKYGKTIFPIRERRPISHREHRRERTIRFGGLRPIAVASLGGVG